MHPYNYNLGAVVFLEMMKYDMIWPLIVIKILHCKFLCILKHTQTWVSYIRIVENGMKSLQVTSGRNLSK